MKFRELKYKNWNKQKWLVTGKEKKVSCRCQLGGDYLILFLGKYWTFIKIKCKFCENIYTLTQC